MFLSIEVSGTRRTGDGDMPLFWVLRGVLVVLSCQRRNLAEAHQ